MQDLYEIGATLGAFFGSNGLGPSHDQLDRAFADTGLAKGDPRTTAGISNPSKMKRVREVFDYASDNDPAAGLRLAERLVALMRAKGCFRNKSEDYPGVEVISAAQRAFERIGYVLGADGSLHPTVIDQLSGKAMTAALLGYVRRINVAGSDAELKLGSSKDLVEAVARHVLTERGGGYNPHHNFATTLAGAFALLGMAVPIPNSPPDSDPAKAIEQGLFDLAVRVNKFRNAQGTGHGRPAPATVANREADMAARTSAAIAKAMLDRL
jgi:hypothetical protein